MHKRLLQKLVFLIAITFFFNQTIKAQKTTTAVKYPSVMWEINGNGLKKRAYLFGTMHVSSKLAFNLSDSFYKAIYAADAIALENDPGTWQQEYLDSWFNRITNLYSVTNSNQSSDYITKKTFQFSYSDAQLKLALSSDAEVINHFLYRNYMGNADFEENTYLDMHIYQCSQKLNKPFYGLENFRETEALMLKAIRAQAGETKRKSRSTEAEEEQTNNQQSDLEKIQDAYRKGNLDLMDSLTKKDMQSEGFYEYFLYQRNHIHANEIEKLLQKNLAVFAAVGAMHLPGKRGVIELLRAKGYTLKPINMGIQTSKQRETINKLKITRNLQEQYAADSLYSVQVPGKLYNFSVAGASVNNQWVHADFGNGAYYMITRVATQGMLWDYDEKRMQLKVDSLLYENIPGKILEKKEIAQNGYKGFDITNKTRKGDIQRYHIYITPVEILVFKMSGFEDYVQGKEGIDFFKSINLKPYTTKWDWFSPKQGGFKIQTPQIPIPNNGNESAVENYFGFALGGNKNEKGFEAYDKETNTYFNIQPKAIINYDLLEEDSFSLALCAESFTSSTQFLPPTFRQQQKNNSYNFIELKGKCTDGDYYSNRICNIGSNYYLLITKYKTNDAAANKFLQSFTPTNYNYKQINTYTDSSLFFTASSPLLPDSITNEFISIARLAKKVAEADNKTSKSIEQYDKPSEKMVFRNDTTNEEVVVISNPYPKYKYIRDTTVFWQNIENDLNIKALQENYYDFFVKEKTIEYKGNSSVMNILFADTNCTQTLQAKCILFNGRLFTLYTMNELGKPLSNAKQALFNSFTPLFDSATNYSLFTPKGQTFLADYNSKDSVTSKFAHRNIDEVIFTEKDFEAITQTIAGLDAKDKDYLNKKIKLLNSLSALHKNNNAANYLMDIYKKTTDTASFQNACILALADMQTEKSFDYVANILINDPPVFENTEDANNLFRNFNDTLILTKKIVANLLPLANIDDFKWKVYGVIENLIDSNLIQANEYESLYNKLFFDARREQKKLLAADEKLMNKEKNEDDEENEKSYSDYDNNIYDLETYNKLLLPFWDKTPNIKTYFLKNLKFKTTEVKLTTAKLLFNNQKPVNDSIWNDIAEDKKYRLKLYEYLKEKKQLHLLANEYKTQEQITKLLLEDEEKVDSLFYLNKYYEATVKGNKGWVYFYKYKSKEKDVDYKIALCGLQPINTTEITSDAVITTYSSKILKTNIPLDEQLTKLLKEELYGLRRSSSNFFDRKSNYNNYLNQYRYND